jgi:flagellar hook assembly protein FlgD
VNGRTITVPDNLIIQFPAAWANFRDFAASDIIGKEVTVAGNIVSMLESVTGAQSNFDSDQRKANRGSN